jgi:deoxycytidylate deaminase
MTRPPQHIINSAIRASLNSPCRSKRGAALFHGDALFTLGWNYKPVGFDCDGSDACKSTCGREAVHAEQMVLVDSVGSRGCDMLHVKTVDGVLVPSGMPSCLECSKLILHAGIARMWLYQNTGWREYTAEQFHRATLKRTRERTVAENATVAPTISTKPYMSMCPQCWYCFPGSGDVNEQRKAAAFDHLEHLIAAGEGGSTVRLSFDDATRDYVIDGSCDAGGFGKTLLEAAEMSLTKEEENG